MSDDESRKKVEGETDVWWARCVAQPLVRLASVLDLVPSTLDHQVAKRASARTCIYIRYIHRRQDTSERVPLHGQ